MAQDEQYPACFGPYLRYAISTRFENFLTDFERFGKELRFFNDDILRLVLLVELKRADDVGAFEQAMGAQTTFDTEFGPDVGKTRYATMRCRTAAVTDQDNAFRIWRDYVSRVELSLPVMPSSKEVQKKFVIHDRSDEGKDPPGSLLIGMLDDGCPFAAAQFLRAFNPASTRVRAIWDQNQDKQPVTINGSNFGQVLPDFAYGLEYRRDFSPLLAAGKIGLDDWIGLHESPLNVIDEDGCYADGGFTSLKFQQAHGAHVMDVLAGRTPISSRIGPLPPGGDRRDPPSWKSDPDDASKAEVVFVQFSKDNIQDATGVWLPTYVVHGIQYILSFAKPYLTKRVIVNLSYGPTTGPHDGLAQLETALAALVAEYNGSGGKPKLEIALAAGNSYLTEGHVAFRGHHQPDQVKWTWRLPPDNPVLCFAEVWMKTAHAGYADVTLTSPSGVVYDSSIPTTAQSPAGVDTPVAWTTDDTMWRLQVKPTVATAAVVAEHGDWTISVTGVDRHASVHAYVARTDANMNVQTGAKLSHFIDPEWEQTRSAAASCTFVNGEFDNKGSLVSRFGTLNGIATAEDSSVHVAGGYVILDGRKSTYSSAGPARHGPLAYRVGPDYLLPCDESYALQGMRAGGTRSGAVFRLIGTSAAAPQLARWVVDATLPPPTDVPSPGDTEEIEKRGGGDLAPP